MVPAITMRSFSEELQTGTYEMLATKPLSETQILLGKFFATCTLLLVTLFPTLIYFLAIASLDLDNAGIDTGATWGSYVGLVLLGILFCAAGTWSSILSSNQIVAFLLGVFICYLIYDAFLRISSLEFFSGQVSYWILSLGAGIHYEAISRGVIDSGDVVYFLSVTAGFLLLSKFTLESKKW
jgi:ABC-2 type transport system permease protein